jgi:predicted Zn-dependent protease
MEKTLFVLSTPDVFEEELKISVETLSHISELGETELEIKIIKNWEIPVHWLSSNKKHIDLDAFFFGVKKPLAGDFPQYDFVLTSKTISDPYHNLVFGFKTQNACLVSLSNLREITSEPMKEEAEKQLIYHEAGHLFGMPHRKEGEISYEMGTHCTNACSMREIEAIHDLRKFANDRKFIGRVYCNPCLEGLRDYFRN